MSECENCERLRGALASLMAMLAGAPYQEWCESEQAAINAANDVLNDVGGGGENESVPAGDDLSAPAPDIKPGDVVAGDAPCPTCGGARLVAVFKAPHDDDVMCVRACPDCAAGENYLDILNSLPRGSVSVRKAPNAECPNCERMKTLAPAKTGDESGAESATKPTIPNLAPGVTATTEDGVTQVKGPDGYSVTALTETIEEIAEIAGAALARAEPEAGFGGAEQKMACGHSLKYLVYACSECMGKTWHGRKVETEEDRLKKDCPFPPEPELNEPPEGGWPDEITTEARSRGERQKEADASVSQCLSGDEPPDFQCANCGEPNVEAVETVKYFERQVTGLRLRITFMERAQSVFGGTERGLKDKLADAERRAESYKGTVSFYVQKSNDLEAKLADLREEVRDLTELRDANEERLKGSDSGRRQSKAFADELRTKLAELKQSYIEEGRRIEQVLGRALGYPRYADDPKNFPDATDEDGVCVGDHVPITLAEEAAAKLAGRL